MMLFNGHLYFSYHHLPHHHFHPYVQHQLVLCAGFMTHPIISIFGKLTTITVIAIINMVILVSVILIHMSHMNNKSDLRTGFMIRPIISIFGMLIIPSLPPPLTLLHIIVIDIHRRRRRISINISNPAIQISYLSLPNVSDPGASRDPFEDPKDSDILAEAARDDKEEEEEL